MGIYTLKQEQVRLLLLLPEGVERTFGGCEEEDYLKKKNYSEKKKIIKI
jgi:hypothetical protein